MDSDDDGDEEKKPIGLAVYCNFMKEKITQDFVQRFVGSFISEEKRENKGIYENVKNFFIIAPTKKGAMDADKNANHIYHNELKI